MRIMETKKQLATRILAALGIRNGKYSDWLVNYNQLVRKTLKQLHSILAAFARVDTVAKPKVLVQSTLPNILPAFSEYLVPYITKPMVQTILF